MKLPFRLGFGAIALNPYYWLKDTPDSMKTSLIKSAKFADFAHIVLFRQQKETEAERKRYGNETNLKYYRFTF